MKKSTLLKIARAMLERAGILFATTGNNAVNLAELVPDVADRRALALAIATWDGTAAKHNPKDKFELGIDWVLMRFASAMLDKEVRFAEMLEAVDIGRRLMIDQNTGLHREETDAELRERIKAQFPNGPAVEIDDPHADHLLAEAVREGRGTVYPAPDSPLEEPPFDVETHAVQAGTVAPAGFTLAIASETSAEIAVHAETVKAGSMLSSISHTSDEVAPHGARSDIREDSPRYTGESTSQVEPDVLAEDIARRNQERDDG